MAHQYSRSIVSVLPDEIRWVLFDRKVEEDEDLPEFTHSFRTALIMAFPEIYDVGRRLSSHKNRCGCRTRLGQLVVMNDDCCQHGLRSRYYAQGVEQHHHASVK